MYYFHLVQRHQVIATADVGFAHINLRHGAATRDLHHVVALDGVEVDADFFDLLNALGSLSGATLRVSLGELAGGKRVRLQLVEESPDQLEAPAIPLPLNAG